MDNGTPKYKRIILKVTGEVFAGPQNFGIDGNTVRAFAQEIKEVKELGCELALVIGGGNIFRGAIAIEMRQVAEPYIRRRATRHLEKGRVVIFAGGTGNPYFTTDTTASLRAMEVGAEVILKATKVDGVYDADPVKNEGARKFAELSYIEVLNRELKVMDSTAISLCMDNNLPIIVFNLMEKGNIKRVVSGEPIGTLVCGGKR